MVTQADGYQYCNLALPLEVSADGDAQFFMQYRTWGFLITVHLILFGTLPPNVSPVLMQAVIGGSDSIVNSNFIRDVFQDAFLEVQRWLSTSPTEVFHDNDSLLLYVASNIGELVSTLSCLWNFLG